jgi:hypothetical protein
VLLFGGLCLRLFGLRLLAVGVGIPNSIDGLRVEVLAGRGGL